MAFLFCFCLCLLPCRAQAVSIEGAIEPISTRKVCELTVSYRYNGTPFAGQAVKVYQIANVSADVRYTMIPPFASSGLSLNDVRTDGEWDAIRTTLEAHILANSIAPAMTAVTNENGEIFLANLRPGLYLVSAVRVVSGDLTCFFDSLLIAVPGLGADGRWQYQVAAAPKPEIIPPAPGPDPDPGPDPGPDPIPVTRFKILKLWKGDGDHDRPQSIEVEIFRDGVSHQVVTLSEETQWAYSWLAAADGASWLVAERNVPEGYTVTVEERGTAFVLTNTLGQETPPEEPPAEEPGAEEPGADEPGTEKPGADDPTPGEQPPAEAPKTGDTPHIVLYTVLMYVSGAVLILLGITGKRKDV